MTTVCPACSKANPATASYCYYDGRHLSNEDDEGPVQAGTLPFPMPFYFPDGQSCANFNQLALACDARWDEARALLADGTWPSFFSAMGRLDLAVAAKQAVKEPDLDVGLSQLLEKFPADALRRPQLALPSTEENLGTLAPGTDHRFELVISNRGLLVLRGMATTDCEWLSLGDGTGAALKMFQTRGVYTLPVRVHGNKLRAGRKPLQGEIVIDTNGGAIKLPVRADIPVRPFPSGTHANDALAGVKSPRELALKAKTHPQEAAVLFEQGAVKAWYASNGWTYPVEGTQASGKSAVQQFFEALGLTKPPLLEINTERLVCQGKVGQRLTLRVKIRTKESRVVYAQAWSNQNWIIAEPGKSQGNQVTILLQIEVPPCPGETVHADVTIEGNGKQQFVVPVTLTVLAARPAVEAEAEEPAGRLPPGWIFAGIGLLLVLAVGIGLFILISGVGNSKDPVANATPVEITKPPPPPPKTEAWWDGIPGTNLTALVKELKKSVPQEQAVFDALAVKDDLDRPEANKKLVEKLPELLRDQKARGPLGKLLAECCVFDPYEPSLQPLRLALMNQIPRNDAAFWPEKKGEELERGFWSVQVFSDALSHRALAKYPQRVQKLAGDLEEVFGPALDITAPADQLQAQTEKLLAERCYRNTLPTAKKSIEHALVMRDKLIAKFPQYLPPTVRNPVDLALLSAGLSKGSDLWPKLKPIVKTCLESNDPTIVEKVVGFYEQADPDLAQNLEGLLAAKWDVAANPKLTQADRAAAIKKTLSEEASRREKSPARDLLAALQTSDAAKLKEAIPKMAAMGAEVRFAFALLVKGLRHDQAALRPLAQQRLLRYAELWRASKLPAFQKTDLHALTTLLETTENTTLLAFAVDGLGQLGEFALLVKALRHDQAAVRPLAQQAAAASRICGGTANFPPFKKRISRPSPSCWKSPRTPNCWPSQRTAWASWEWMPGRLFRCS